MTATAKSKPSLSLNQDASQKLIDWVSEIENSEATYLEKSQAIARRLGAHYRPDGLTEIGFWTPELTSEVMRPRDIYLEAFTAIEPVDFQAKEQKILFRRDRLRLRQRGEYFFGVVAGMQVGNREQLGSLYWLRYFDPQNYLRTIRDVLAHSLPFGVFAPAELYDLDSLQKNRADLDYFARTGIKPGQDTSKSVVIPRLNAPTNILQLHLGTASAEGTFAGLTRIFQTISDKLANNEPLTPAEENYVGYDAVQVLPTEPTIEYRDDNSPESEFFVFAIPKTKEREDLVLESDRLEVLLKKPNTQDWGYDVPILGSAATNSALLSSLRPDEVWDFIAILHNFSTGPIQLIYDLVYGHADNQSELLISRQYLKGPNMYGQDLNHQLPMVRAMLLEMQRRKINKGADGIRIDGGQDFRFFNPLTGRVEQDDAYLLAMADIVQEIDGYQRLLFTIFEDGRPWPEEGWEETSTYRDLIELMPESYQWGPLIFAHNTPALQGFWEEKWTRVCEVIYQGENWITGCGNHDTLRRGNQIALDQAINWHLGDLLSTVFANAYDNPAVTLWIYAFSPGLPMDFINATMRAPWMFFRNTDDRYGVKVVSEEIGFLDWQITDEIYDQSDLFLRLKSLGFEKLDQLKEFGHALAETMIKTDYDLRIVIEKCQLCLSENGDSCDIEKLKLLRRPDMIAFLKELDIPRLKDFALQFMEDCFTVCNVSHYLDLLNPQQTHFNLRVRQFRHQHPWLSKNLSHNDRFNKVSDPERTIFYGLRSNPDNAEEKFAFVAHMGGEPLEVTLGDWLQLSLDEWQVAIASPGLEENDNLADLRCFQLADSQTLLLQSR